MQTQFLDFEIACSNQALYPRFETETLALCAIDLIKTNQIDTVADFGTGSGILATAIAKTYPNVSVDAYEVDSNAVTVARTNFDNHKLTNVNLINADWQTTTKSYALIVSNPPYVTSGYCAHLSETNQLADPLVALDGGIDGLDAFRSIIDTANQNLMDNGFLLLEHGVGQHHLLDEYARQHNFAVTSWERDLQGLKRIICLQKTS